MMRPYWIEIPGRLGVGIAARSRADALALFAVAFGSEHQAGEVRWIKDMNELDQGHVAPNMGNWFKRGVWYPLGYEHVSN